jgi:twitching motility two-component system response regulator PilH
VLKTWNSSIEDRQQLFQTCAVRLDVLAFTASPPERFSESRARGVAGHVQVFVEGLWAAVRQIQAADRGRKSVMKKRVLVVDDSATDRQLVTAAAEAGLHRDGRSGRRRCARENAAGTPPLIVLDIILPWMNGYQVLRRLKSCARTKDIKVILVSSKGQDADRYWGLRQGADDYIAAHSTKRCSTRWRNISTSMDANTAHAG